MHRRELLFLGATLALAGCVAEPPIEAVNPAEMRVTGVDVSLSNPDAIARQLERWKIGVTAERLVTDARGALQQEMLAKTSAGSRPVAASFAIGTIKLDSSIPGLIKPVFVGPFSTIEGQMLISDARSGEVLFRRYVMGDDNPGEVTLGAAMKSGFSMGKSMSKAYSDLISNFAEDIVRDIFLKQRSPT